MPQLKSPGVLTREIDLTGIVPGVSTNDGAIAGVFRWGPIGELLQIDSEDTLLARYGKPTNLNAETWFTAASFLAYTDSLFVSRAANTVGNSPDFTAYVVANSNIVVLTGASVPATINTTSLLLAPGDILLSSTQNAVFLATNARIDDVINSTAFSLSTASSVSVVSGLVGNTITIPTATVASANTTKFTVSNTSGLVAGYMITASANLAMVNTNISASIAAVVNTTVFTSNVAMVLADGSTSLTIVRAGDLDIQLISPTCFSAIANTGRVANLEYATIANQGVFTARANNIDYDIKFIARYPGDLGNSLRVSVCGNPNGFSSSIDLSALENGNTATGSRAILPVFVNSNTARFSIMSPNSFVASAQTALYKSYLQVTDTIEVGNTLMGTQFMKITSISNTTVVGGSANVVLSITCNKEDTLAIATTGDANTLVAGMQIATAANTYLTDMVVNSIVNTTAFHFTTTPVVNVTSSSVTFSPTGYFDLTFEDPYFLGDDYKFNSSNSSTKIVQRNWEFHNIMDQSVGQSPYLIEFGNSSINSDELHIVVVDDEGKFTGVPGEILETYRHVSRATDGKSQDGIGNYWKDVINQSSQYVWAVNDIAGGESDTAENLIDSSLDVVTLPLDYGHDGADEHTIPISLLANAWDKFKSKEDIDISLVLTGTTRSYVLANYLIDNIVETRQDCVLFASPQRADVVGNPGNEAAACVEFRNLLRSTSYAVLDSGWKYMLDRYNDIYRWIPLNGDIAGLCARTDDTNDPWWSPAGFNRGQIKNVVKLAWNPRQTARDTLYKNGINPVVQFLGEGTILYGDKTLLHKPSAFDRINVRRLFIVLRKAIAEAAKFLLFDFNDEFTRAQFKNMVNPYLRDIKGRRGIYDFLVVCDETNNTPVVIDRNEFIGDIYIKPARSINFIYLNFIAVPTGIAFNEVVGKW